MKLTQQQIEAHRGGAANLLRGKTAGRDYRGYILSRMFCECHCDQWGNEAGEVIPELDRQQGRALSDAQKALVGRDSPCQTAGGARESQQQR